MLHPILAFTADRTVVALTLVTLAGAILAGAWKLARGASHALSLWEEVAREFRPNGGSSLVDRVRQMSGDITDIRREMTDQDGRLEQRVTDLESWRTRDRSG